MKSRVNKTCSRLQLYVIGCISRCLNYCTGSRINRTRPFFSGSVFLVLILVSQLVVPGIGYSADDDYLKQLESEAQNSAKFNTNNANKPEKGRSHIKEFEHLLKFERPSTYEFYQKLGQPSKQKVVETYYKEQSLSIASKKIFDLYFEQNK